MGEELLVCVCTLIHIRLYSQKNKLLFLLRIIAAIVMIQIDLIHV